MPFTFSHPALLFPFKYLPRSWVSITGLVTGSIAPDFEYIINGTRTFSHTLKGAVWLDLPVAIIIALIFHNFVREKLVAHLPKFLYKRFAGLKNIRWNLYFKKHSPIVIVSVLFGIGTHLLWDSFTHGTGYFVIRLPVLQQNVAVEGIRMPMQALVWFLSSIAGAIVIIIFVYFLPKKYSTSKKSIAWFWIKFILIMALISAFLFSRIKNADTDWDAVGMVFLRSALLSVVLTAVFTKGNNKSYTKQEIS